jgi:hypothetical protein
VRQGYSDTIKPVLERDAELSRIEAEIAKTEERLRDLRAQRFNRVSKIVCRMYYPSAED